jgi:hypothetical protein
MYFIFSRFVDTIGALRYMLTGHNKGRFTNGVTMDRSSYSLPIFMIANRSNMFDEKFGAVCELWNKLNENLPVPQVRNLHVNIISPDPETQKEV